jgi:hypothetical protein
VARSPAAAVSDGELLWDGGPWDMEEGVDFPVGGWGKFACQMKAVARILGGVGSAAQIHSRDKKGKLLTVTYRWQYLAMDKGHRGGL